MNQILITGEEKTKSKKVKKEKKVLPVGLITSFFAISIMIVGICMISGSVYAKERINEVVAASLKPQVEINRNDDDNTVEINVKHIRAITKIAYKWNEEEETIIDGKNRKNISETIDLIGGKNTLTVAITEENGQTVTYEKTYTVGNIPEIKLEAVSNGVKLIATSEAKISYIVYSWDNGEEQKIEVVDENDMKAKKTQAVVGDTEPVLNVDPDYVDGKVAFKIDAEDDEQITKVEITHNGGKKQVIDVNDKTYHNDVIMTTGETNTIIVTVTNINGLTKTSRVKFDNK